MVAGVRHMADGRLGALVVYGHSGVFGTVELCILVTVAFEFQTLFLRIGSCRDLHCEGDYGRG